MYTYNSASHLRQHHHPATPPPLALPSCLNNPSQKYTIAHCVSKNHTHYPPMNNGWSSIQYSLNCQITAYYLSSWWQVIVHGGCTFHRYNHVMYATSLNQSWGGRKSGFKILIYTLCWPLPVGSLLLRFSVSLGFINYIVHGQRVEGYRSIRKFHILSRPWFWRHLLVSGGFSLRSQINLALIMADGNVQNTALIYWKGL